MLTQYLIVLTNLVLEKTIVVYYEPAFFACWLDLRVVKNTTTGLLRLQLVHFYVKSTIVVISLSLLRPIHF